MGTKLQLSVSPDLRDRDFLSLASYNLATVICWSSLRKELLWSGLGQTKRRVWNCLRVGSSRHGTKGRGARGKRGQRQLAVHWRQSFNGSSQGDCSHSELLLHWLNSCMWIGSRKSCWICPPRLLLKLAWVKICLGVQTWPIHSCMLFPVHLLSQGVH